MTCGLCAWVGEPTEGQTLALCYATPEVITVELGRRACNCFTLRGE